MANYARLDKALARMVQRDQELRPLIEDGFVERDGVVYVRASVLAEFLGYKTASAFDACVDRAKVTAHNAGREVSDHFVTTDIFHGVNDTLLSLWAVSATIMEADSSKKPVAIAKNFFANQLEERSKTDEARLKERHVARKNHKRLHATAEQAGVKSTKDHAIFDDHGYRGMYGMGVRDVERAKGVPQKEQLLDCADYTELAANNLRMSLTADKLIRDDIGTPRAANNAHYNVGQIVRKAVQDASGMPPERLPLAPKTIDQLTKEKNAELKRIE